jgi:hypothetical protein
VYEGFVKNSEAQDRAFEHLESRVFSQYIYPVLQAEIAAAHARGSIPTGDDIQAWPLTGGGSLFESTRRGIAEALRVPNQEVIDSNIRMLQTKLRQYYNDENRYYTVGPDGQKYKVPWERFPKTGDYAERRDANGRLEGYGPQASCTSTLEQATCTVR